MEPTLIHIVEAIIFATERPVAPSFLLEVINHQRKEEGHPSLTTAELEPMLDQLLEKYQAPSYPFEVRKVAEGYQFFTKPVLYPYVKLAVVAKNQKRLSRAALETLSIIAYRQPITKAEMEFIRGVNCDYAVQKLLDKQLVSILGRSDLPGRPLIYGTSPFFMEYFGMADMSDLPKLKEFEELAEDHLEEYRQHQAVLSGTKEEENHHGERKETREESLLEGTEAGDE
ncbi:MAG: SMC-Scp complex subunit ScpB [Bacteroidota bacterium]